MSLASVAVMSLGAIEDLADQLHESGRSLLLCGAREQPAQLMQQAEFERRVDAENICPSISDALARATVLHKQPHPSPQSEQVHA